MALQNIEVVERENGYCALVFKTDEIVGRSQVREKKDRNGASIGTMKDGVFVPVTTGGNPITARAYWDAFSAHGRKFKVEMKIIPVGE